MFYEETMQPIARHAFRRFFKKQFAAVSILAPYDSLQIPYIIQKCPIRICSRKNNDV
jgi:hypothetical protein